jgi:transcriptional regulator with XRE-family HTH domain
MPQSLHPTADRTYYRTHHSTNTGLSAPAEAEANHHKRPGLEPLDEGGARGPDGRLNIRTMATTTAKPVAAADADERVRYLRREMGLTEGDLATATGAADRTVRRWLAGTTPQPRHAERLDDLKTVVEELADSLTAKGLRQWLHGRNRYLEGARPIECLAKGEFDAVYKAAQAFSRGYYL